jgi:hypothetical protein
MDINQIENNIEALLNSFSEENFIYGLLAAYGLPNAAVTRLRNGEYNLSKNKNQILWKKRVCYQIQKTGDLHSTIDELKKSPAIAKQHPRFVIVTDFNTLLAIDTENSDTLDIPLKDLTRHFDFFLPWAGMEKSQLQRENPADIKAAERMGRLYDLILEENPIESEEQRHSLNVFFTRLLFCYFAEDTGIFPSGIFVNGIASHTSEDGSDLQSYLFKVFEILNQQDRSKCPAFLSEYPYVNGGLFATSSPVPRFNAKSRKILIECGALNWKAINPDIFGSMMQAVVHSDERSGKGMHYTSVVNIMKVIEPLFLNDLREELESAGDNKQKLQKLLDRIYNIRIFDPACGSGNFLIIAYKELCKLEIEIFRRMSPHGQMSFKFQNKVKINQFYGIEIDDFAHETAKLSLWLAEHQMNLAFREVFGDARPTLPLQEGGNITCGNATRLSWQSVCPNNEGETFIIGNPPYLGFKMQTADQKGDIAAVFIGRKDYKKLDYTTCWIMKAAQCISGRQASFAFVSTNSICQGEHVSLLWPSIFELKLEIGFAHTSFKWKNNARGNAGVMCCIVGVRNLCKQPKFIFSDLNKCEVENITPYLSSSGMTAVHKRSRAISNLPSMTLGNMPKDDGNLILNETEKELLLTTYPTCRKFIRKLIGAEEFINRKTRWCLWITPDDSAEALKIQPIADRVERVRAFRMASTDQAANKMAKTPFMFREQKVAREHSLIVPTVTSEKRQYIPMGILDRDSIVVAPNNVIYDPPLYVFSILSSRMHMVWVRAVCGRLEDRLRYSSVLCYNTFPFPVISKAKEASLEALALRIIDERELYSERTIAELYDPSKMPASLRNLHLENDRAVETCYRAGAFLDDEQRLKVLFRFYNEMLSVEEEDGSNKCQISLM